MTKHGKRDPDTICPTCQRGALKTRRATDMTAHQCQNGHRWYITPEGGRFQVAWEGEAT